MAGQHADAFPGMTGCRLGPWDRVDLVGEPFLESALPVSRLVTAAFSAVGTALADVLGTDARPVVHRGLADAWSGLHARPIGRVAPSPWDPLSGAFPTGDGSWIRTHANAPRHRAALLDALGLGHVATVGRDVVAGAVAEHAAEDLESSILERGGVAGALRSPAAWDASGAGRAVAEAPVVSMTDGTAWDGRSRWRPRDGRATGDRPLAGLRVLDLTRVIAGPACTQVLAGLGADVLRIDPPDWDEPAVLPLVMWNKRTARVDARTPAGIEALRSLLGEADVLVHGYRAGVLERLGVGHEERARLRPGLVEVAERAYGWTGPWAGRRGFDSVVQFCTGIAWLGAAATGADAPVPLPVQALDWATGSLAAAAALAGLARRQSDGVGSTWRASLARTALALRTLGAEAEGPVDGRRRADPDALPTTTLRSGAGPFALIDPPVSVGPVQLRFDRVATALGGDLAAWR